MAAEGSGAKVESVPIIKLPLGRAGEAVALWPESGLTRPWNDPHNDLMRAVAGPSSGVLAAVDRDVLAGTAMVGHDGYRGWVDHLAVRLEQRRTGLGGELMRASEQWLRQRACRRST